MTIRRDLDLLVDEGIAHRVRGGAVAVGPQEFAARVPNSTRGRRAASPTSCSTSSATAGAIGIDASSTMQRLAARLGRVARPHRARPTGSTRSGALQGHAGVTALLTGGELDESTGSLVGPLATRAARDVMLRRLFVSASALDPELGSSESTLLEAEVKMALATAAAEVVLAVDTSKLGHRAPAGAASISGASTCSSPRSTRATAASTRTASRSSCGEGRFRGDATPHVRSCSIDHFRAGAGARVTAVFARGLRASWSAGERAVVRRAAQQWRGRGTP